MVEIETEIVVGKKPSPEKLPLKQLVVSGYKQLLNYALQKFSKKMVEEAIAAVKQASQASFSRRRNR